MNYQLKNLHLDNLIINTISSLSFSWPSDKICPKSFFHGGPQVRVLSALPNAEMEIHILPEIFNIITQIHLPTVIKVEEVKKEEILKALKKIDVQEQNVRVI